jgi:hypothetical protein
MERWNKPVKGNIWTGVKSKFRRIFIPNSSCYLLCILCCFRHGEDIQNIAYSYYCGVQIGIDGEEGECVSWFQSFAVFWILYFFGWFPSFWILFSDVYVHSGPSS